MTGTCEIAFDMIQNVFLNKSQCIVGLYEAALPTNLPGGKEQSPIAQYLCENINANFKDAVFIALKADMPPMSDTSP